jgi:hypothetical protein
MPSKRVASCTTKLAAPRWMIIAALGLLLVLGVALAFQYLVRPMAIVAGLERFTQSASPPDGQTNPTATSEPRTTFAYLYMDGCGWCERFTPIWNAFETKHRMALYEAGVDVVKHEASEVPDALKNIAKGFPTVVFVASDGKTHIFQDERTEENLVSFLEGRGVKWSQP